MKRAFKYLDNNYSTNPWEIDRLIVSAFLEINKLKPLYNTLLKSYLILTSDKEEYHSLIEFKSIINGECVKFDFEELIKLFEFVISPSDRIINGAVYTPSYIRKYIVKESFSKVTKLDDGIKISDIACGCGGFLFNAAIELKNSTNKTYEEIFKENIFGLDIQNYSIIRTKLLLSLLALFSGEDIEAFDFNLYQGNSLDFEWKTKLRDFKGFDLVLGNPPYVCARNLDKETKEKLKNWEVCASGNSDLYIPFFQIAVENLSENGTLGFITMNSFFKSLNGRALRSYFQRAQLAISIIDFGAEQVFKSKSTYTCLCFIEKRNEKFISFATSESKELKKKISFKKIKYSLLDSKRGWNLKDNSTISRIEDTGIPFGELYKTRHGIATLKNDVYIFKPVKEDVDFYYLQNGSSYKIEKGICKNIINSNKLSREVNLNRLKEKVIFPYSNQGKVKILDENFIKHTYPETYKYLKGKRKILEKRDKGNGNYENWFAYGRTQSLEIIKNKMFFPKYSDKTPNLIINSDDDLLFYNGLAIVGSNRNEMRIVKKIMESRIFWYYVKTTSKPYSSNYYSLQRNYIKNFGICKLNKAEIEFVLNEKKRAVLNQFFESKYKVRIK